MKTYTPHGSSQSRPSLYINSKSTPASSGSYLPHALLPDLLIAPKLLPLSLPVSCHPHSPAACSKEGINAAITRYKWLKSVSTRISPAIFILTKETRTQAQVFTTNCWFSCVNEPSYFLTDFLELVSYNVPENYNLKLAFYPWRDYFWWLVTPAKRSTNHWKLPLSGRSPLHFVTTQFSKMQCHQGRDLGGRGNGSHSTTRSSYFWSSTCPKKDTIALEMVEKSNIHLQREISSVVPFLRIFT